MSLVKRLKKIEELVTNNQGNDRVSQNDVIELCRSSPYANYVLTGLGDKFHPFAFQIVKDHIQVSKDWGFKLPTVKEMKRRTKIHKILEKRWPGFRLDYPKEEWDAAEAKVIKEEAKARRRRKRHSKKGK